MKTGGEIMEDKLLRILAADSTMNKVAIKVIVGILFEKGLISSDEIQQRIAKECKEEREKFGEGLENLTLEDIIKALEQ